MREFWLRSYFIDKVSTRLVDDITTNIYKKYKEMHDCTSMMIVKLNIKTSICM